MVYNNDVAFRIDGYAKHFAEVHARRSFQIIHYAIEWNYRRRLGLSERRQCHQHQQNRVHSFHEAFPFFEASAGE
jgi:hypothetical protein